jgi:regulator of sigma D
MMRFSGAIGVRLLADLRCVTSSFEMQRKVAMDRRTEKAEKANRAANAIGQAMTKTLADLRPTFAAEYDLDDQLVTLAIAKASVGVAADAASEAVGMAIDECDELEDRLHDVISDAISELEVTDRGEK